MPSQTRPPAPRLPARLPRQPQAPADRGREVRLGALALLGLVVVVIGVPVALALLVGNPLPTSGPSSEWLQTELTSTLVINVMACALWLAWAHFVVCVLSEWWAARRGSGLPGDVPLGGGSQLIARRLVAATLLLAGAAALTPGAGSQGSSDHTVPTVAATSSSAVQAASPPDAAQVRADVVAQEEQQQAAEKAAAQKVTKTYLVQPPDGRRYDSLWDIADRTLGDPLRYREIFALNKDRPQPDGRTLVEADLIHPGWTLLMPADARGPGIHVATPAPPAKPATPVQQAPSLPGEAPAPVQAAAPEADGFTAQQGLLGGGLLLAGLLTALSARRGPYSVPADAELEGALRLAADPGRAELLDRLLRDLAHSCTQQGRPLPEVALAYLGASDLVLHLSAPAAAPPAPWVASDDDRVWTAEVTESTPLPEARDVVAPYPALVNVATVDDHELLIDLETAPGLVSVTGSPARDVVVSLAVELATNAWSDGVAVTLVGFGDDLADVAPEHVLTADRLDQVLDSVRQEAERSTAALRSSGASDVLTGRLQRTADRRRPRVLVLSGPPTVQEAAALAALVRGGRTPVAVLVVGEVPGAGWRFHVDESAGIDLGVFGVSGRPRTLPPRDYAPVLAALREADEARRRRAVEVAAMTPASAVAVAAVREPAAPGATPAGPPPVWALLPPTPGVPVALTRPTEAAVHVELLGPVTVSAPGPLDEAARGLLTELVVAVALHREGLHEALLRALVWPRGAEDDVVADTIAQAQAWLGTGPSGPRLFQAPDGRFRLSDEVSCDLDVLAMTAARAHGASERAVLDAGLRLIDGPALSGTPTGRYRWLRFHAAAAEARVLATAAARRAALLAAQDGDRPAASQALSRGLDLAPEAEALWRDLLRLTPPADLPDVVALMHDVLAARGARPEPDTDALVERLLPGRTQVVGA